MKRVSFILCFMLISKALLSQVVDTIPLRSVYINDFCIGDSVSKMYEIFGKPIKVEDKKQLAGGEYLDDQEPSKKVYYYSKNVYFSEPYLVAKGRIGEVFVYGNDTINMQLNLLVNNEHITFKINDSINMAQLEHYFPKSLAYSQTLFSKEALSKGYNYIVIGLSEQNEYFPSQYPFITLALSYKANKLKSIKTYYFVE